MHNLGYNSLRRWIKPNPSKQEASSMSEAGSGTDVAGDNVTFMKYIYGYLGSVTE